MATHGHSHHGHGHGHAHGVLPHHIQDLSLRADVAVDFTHETEVKPSPGVASLARKWLRTILSDTATRNLFFFLLINLSFAFVELLYGMWTNSLGLISDSFHMFFDCTALLAGLVATLVARWPANEKFSFGYVRAEVVAGFVNALFLLFIAFFIFAEAMERAFEPPDVKHERLMVVSVVGFIVNLIGIFVFQHGASGGRVSGSFAHSGHGHSHSHGHSHTNHHHSHSHGGSNVQIMHGIFLHILADTLGSIGVIISSAIIHSFGWMIADPICSMFIAILIMISVFPLMKESLGVLMQRTPYGMDHTLPASLRKLYELEGVLQVQDAHFWTLCSGVHLGSLRLDTLPSVDSTRLLLQAKAILAQAGVEQTTIEINTMD